MRLTNNYNIHFCVWPFSEDCREWGAPSRVYINTRLWHVQVSMGLPYRGLQTEPKAIGRNRLGNLVEIHDVIGRRWAREKFKIVWRVREHTGSQNVD